MELVNLMQLIATSSPPSYSVWFGEEQKILDIYLDKIKELGYKAVYCDTVNSVISQIHRKSLDKSKKVYIIIEDLDYQNKEEIWAKIKKEIKITPHLLILRYAKLNKTKKFYKQNKDVCVEFPKLDEQVLCGYILTKHLSGFGMENAKKLCSMCDNDYGRIILECDKIEQYSKAKSLPYDKAFNVLLKQDAIYSTIGDITFELTDAILYGDLKKSANLLTQAKLKGEPAMVIASILYNGFRNMLAYQGLGKDKSNASERTGLDNKQLWVIKKNIGGYSLKELQRNMLICQEVESGIKKGLIDDSIALEYLVVKCLQ